MKSKRNRVVFFFTSGAVLAMALIASSCSSGPQPLQPGTPPFFWSAAKTTFSAGDYVKTTSNLGDLLRTENEFTARALPWQLIMTAGMADGYVDLAEEFEFGARAKRDNPTPFRKVVNACRVNASQLALQFAEAFQKFQQANKDANIALAFPFPVGNSMPVPSLKRVSSGILVPDAEYEDIQKQTLQRGVLLLTCRALGAGEDTAKAAAVFKNENPQAPRNSFMAAMAQALYDQSQLYSRDKLDRPDRFEMFNKQALAALQGIPQSKEIKDLTAKIQKALKKK